MSVSVALTGHVLDIDSGVALADANIYIQRGQNHGRHTTSDAGGRFQFSDLERGTLAILVAARGYTPAERELTLSADTAVVMLMSRFVPDMFMLSGRVTDVADGMPLADATLTILDGPDASRTTATDAQGLFYLAGVTRGGFTIRIRRSGYDSVFRGIRLIDDTVVDVAMRRAQQSLAGTWTGEITSSGRARLPIPEATMTHAGSTITSTFPAAAFTSTLANASAIGSTTQVTGTLTVRRTGGIPRIPIPCDGTGVFTGTVNWTRLAITAPQVTYSCGGTESVTLSLVRQQ